MYKKGMHRINCAFDDVDFSRLLDVGRQIDQTTLADTLRYCVSYTFNSLYLMNPEKIYDQKKFDTQVLSAIHDVKSMLENMLKGDI